MNTPSTGPGSDGIAIRSPESPDDYRRFITPLARAFAEEMGEGEWEIQRQVVEWDRFIGALDGDDVVGCSGLYSFRLTIPGGEVPAAGVTAVGVVPTHRRRGILRAMMRRLFDDARERGEPVAVLWASEGAIYQRFGYGMATLQGSVELERSRAAFARPVTPVGRLRLVGRDEAVERFAEVYERIRPTLPGALTRTDAFWRLQLLNDAEWMRHGSGPKFLALLEEDGVATGYVIYRHKAEFDDRGAKSQLTVVESYATNPAAERTIWRWILDMDLVATVKAWRQPVAHPLQLQLAEPRRLGLSVADGLWLRILDLPAALVARRFAGPGRLVLEVTDEFVAANAGRWLLDVDPDGRGRVTRSEDEPDLVLDIADLAAAYLGTFSLHRLAAAGRVVERRFGGVDLGSRLMAADVPASTTTMF